MVGIILAATGTAPYAVAGLHTDQVLLAVALFVSGLGIGAVLLASMTATYRGLTTEQMAPATSASRIFQQIGGSFGTVMLALVLQHRINQGHAPATAFQHAFTWALALAVLPSCRR